MARLVTKNRHQKNMCHNEIGLCAQNIDINIGSTLKQNWESICNCFKEKENLHVEPYNF